ESNRLRLGISKAQKNTSQLVLLIGRKRPDAFNGLFEQFCHETIVPATSVENQAWIYMRALSTICQHRRAGMAKPCPPYGTQAESSHYAIASRPSLAPEAHSSGEAADHHLAARM